MNSINSRVYHLYQRIPDPGYFQGQPLDSFRGFIAFLHKNVVLTSEFPSYRREELQICTRYQQDLSGAPFASVISIAHISSPQRGRFAPGVRFTPIFIVLSAIIISSLYSSVSRKSRRQVSCFHKHQPRNVSVIGF